MARPSRVIAVEEHFSVPGFVRPDKPNVVPNEMVLRTDFDERVKDMDKFGIDFQMCSVSGPRLKPTSDLAKLVADGRTMNDFLAQQISKHPARFGGFAHLPLQDPAASADELERCVRELGFKGALVRNHILGEYLDAPQFLPLWERAAALDVPIYIHPTPPLVEPASVLGYPMLAGAMWGYACDAGSHALRLVLSGLFDRFPKLKVMLGHMGEGLPYHLWRIDSRFLLHEPKVKLQKMPSQYIKENFWMSTSGTFADAPLVCAVTEMGADRLMFALDYPNEDNVFGIDWLSNLPLPQEQIELIAHGNAERLLNI